MKTKGFAFLCFILLTGICFSQNNLSVEIKFEKLTVLYKEAVFLEVIVKNNSTIDVTVDRPSIGTGSINIIFLDGDGKDLPYCGPIETTIGKSQITITAGDDYTYLYDYLYHAGKIQKQ
jgi:hypothetical protein